VAYFNINNVNLYRKTNKLIKNYNFNCYKGIKK